MSDLRTLTDAFAELERRADAAMSAAHPPRAPARRLRLVPVAAAVIVAACLVTGGVLLTPGDGAQTGGPPPGVSVAPSTSDELAVRFRAVLGDTATFEVRHTEVPDELRIVPGTVTTPRVLGPAIVGTLTAAGVTGDFVLYVYQDDSGGSIWCSPGTQQEDCSSNRSPDGTWVGVGTRRSTESPPRITYEANVLRPDGIRMILQLSNASGGNVLAPLPPLTLDELVAIGTSNRW